MRSEDCLAGSWFALVCGYVLAPFPYDLMAAMVALNLSFAVWCWKMREVRDRWLSDGG